MAADLKTPFGLRLYRYGYWDDVLEQIVSILRPGDIFIDGGANVGMMTVVAAQRVGTHGRVMAFEPACRTRNRLAANVALAAHANVTIFPYALGDRAGERTFVVMTSNPLLSSFSPEYPEEGMVTNVGVCTLDEIVPEEDLQRVRLVKLDLEGAEVAALRGARRLLAESPADFIVENEAQHLRRQGADSHELFSLFDEYGLTPQPLTPPNVLFSRRERAELGTN